MEHIGIENFNEMMRERFGVDVDTVLRNAIDLVYPLDEMFYIICSFIKYTSDSLICEEAFMADVHKLGLIRTIEGLKGITAAVYSYSRRENRISNT